MSIFIMAKKYFHYNEKKSIEMNQSSHISPPYWVH